MLTGFSFPISYILFPAALFAIFFVLRGLADTYVLVRFGESSLMLLAALIIFWVGSLFIFADTFAALNGYDLSQPFTSSSFTLPGYSTNNSFPSALPPKKTPLQTVPLSK